MLYLVDKRDGFGLKRVDFCRGLKKVEPVKKVEWSLVDKSMTG